MLLYNSKKKQQKQNAKGERLLIIVNVVGSPGPLRFVVFEKQLISKVIAISLKNYRHEGRLPLLGTDPNDLVLYCPHAGQQPLNPWENIGSFGSRTFILCKKSQARVERVGNDAISNKGTVALKGTIVRKGTFGVAKQFGVCKSWINKPLLKITSH